MRNLSIAFVSALLVVSVLVVPCHAKAKKDNAATKLAWGVVNLLMAPVELVKGITTEPYDKGPAYDLPVGIGKGFYNMGKRLGAGTYDAATFPVPVPKGYAPILKEDRKEKKEDVVKEKVKEEVKEAVKEEVKKEEVKEEKPEEKK